MKQGSTLTGILAAIAAMMGILWGVQVFADSATERRVECLEDQARSMRETNSAILVELEHVGTLLEAHIDYHEHTRREEGP